MMAVFGFTTPPNVEHDGPGTRPAGGPDECFYCHRSVGQLHDLTCVVLLAHVRYRVTANLPSGKREGKWITFDPWCWFQDGDSGDPKLDEYAGHWRFARNEGSWCSDNAEVDWNEPDTEDKLREVADPVGCSCAFLDFELDEVLDNLFHIDEDG